jgi:hypothetical protein
MTLDPRGLRHQLGTGFCVVVVVGVLLLHSWELGGCFHGCSFGLPLQERKDNPATRLWGAALVARGARPWLGRCAAMGTAPRICTSQPTPSFPSFSSLFLNWTKPALVILRYSAELRVLAL